MLEKIKIQGYKSLKDVEVELSNINIIIGANGAGKSNFCRFFEFLKDLDNLNKIYKEDVWKYLYCGTKVTQNIEFELIMNNIKDDCKISINKDGKLFILDNYAPTYSSEEDFDAGISEYYCYIFELNQLIQDILIQNYHFNDTSSFSDIRKSYNIADNLTLHKSGGNVASVLYRIKGEHPHIYELILRRIKTILPFLDDFVLQPRGEHQNMISLNWKQKNMENVFDSFDLSDGSIRYIALTVLINLPENMRPSIIIIDEPELGLHPQALSVLSAMMRETVIVYPETQYIIATQSKDFVDNFSLNDIIVNDKIGNESKFKRLKEEDYKEWLENFTNSEIWEKNLMGGNVNG